MPAAAIVQSNNLASATAIKPGQRLVIPRYEAPTHHRQRHRAAAGRAGDAAGQPHVHVVAPGETLSKVSRTYKKSLSEIAKANNIPPHTQVKVGDRLVIPGVRAPQARRRPSRPRNRLRSRSSRSPAAAEGRCGAAGGEHRAQHHAGRRQSGARGQAGDHRRRAADLPLAGPRPRHQRLRPEDDGQQNDGINVAVPEGTPVKAAEDGVVAYAGNELKSYGNLVLIRHSNGYVTAYAHASEIMVKRDEPIKRGQVIAKSGQTGNVTAPQLHFEIRKGSSPVDPMPYLDKGGNT